MEEENEDDLLRQVGGSIYDFSLHSDWFCTEAPVEPNIINVPAQLVRPAKPRAASFPLLQLPPELFEIVTHDLPAQDLFAMWRSGDRRIQLLMGARGGVERLNLKVIFSRGVGLPSFPSYLPRLRSISLHFLQGDDSSHGRFYQRLHRDCGIASWPRTLEKISLKCSSAFVFFYNREHLAYTYQADPLPGEMQKGATPTRWMAVNTQLTLPTPSNFFYNLDELFPNLRTLEVESTDTSGGWDDFEDNGAPFLKIYRRTALHLKIDGSPRTGDYDADNDILEEEEDDEDKLSEEAFMKSLPQKSLTRLKLDMEHTWFLESFVHLPTSVTDLEVYNVVDGSCKDDDEETDYCTVMQGIFESAPLSSRGLEPLVRASNVGKNKDATKILEILQATPSFPSSIQRLSLIGTSVTDFCFLLFKLPSELKSLSYGGSLPHWMTKHLPNTLTRLQFDGESDSENVSWASSLPRGLSSLSCGWNFVNSFLWDNESPSDVANRINEARRSLPPFLTKLRVSTPQSINPVLPMIQHLPLQELKIDVDDFSTSQELSVQDISILPSSLTSLRFFYAMVRLHTDAFAQLPSRLRTLHLYSVESWSSVRFVQFRIDSLPKTLTDLSVSYRPVANYSTGSWPPGLTSLVLRLDLPVNDAAKYREAKIRNLFRIDSNSRQHPKPTDKQFQYSPMVHNNGLNSKQRRDIRRKLKKQSQFPVDENSNSNKQPGNGSNGLQTTYPAASAWYTAALSPSYSSPASSTSAATCSSSLSSSSSSSYKSWEPYDSYGRLLPSTLTYFKLVEQAYPELPMDLPRSLRHFSHSNSPRQYHFNLGDFPSSLTTLKIPRAQRQASSWHLLPRGLTDLRICGNLRKLKQGRNSSLPPETPKTLVLGLPRNLTRLRFTDCASSWAPHLNQYLPRNLQIFLVDKWTADLEEFRRQLPPHVQYQDSFID